MPTHDVFITRDFSGQLSSLQWFTHLSEVFHLALLVAEGFEKDVTNFISLRVKSLVIYIPPVQRIVFDIYLRSRWAKFEN